MLCVVVVRVCVVWIAFTLRLGAQIDDGLKHVRQNCYYSSLVQNRSKKGSMEVEPKNRGERKGMAAHHLHAVVSKHRRDRMDVA